MKAFTIENNKYLNENINGFHHTDYISLSRRSKIKDFPMYILTLKNNLANVNKDELINAQNELSEVLLTDLPKIMTQIDPKQLTVCVVPRAKNLNYYKPNQLLFRETVKNVVNQLGDNFQDGTSMIQRHTNTKTTHLKNAFFFPKANDGKEPYIGISKDTCTFNENIRNLDILLIDDIYTKNANVDEDMIQSLLNCGAKSVTFYAIGKTIR